MAWTNFHTHSHYCDGSGGLKSYIKEAIDRKMYALGFSSHTPVSFPSFWHMKNGQLDNYIREVAILKDTYREDIKLYCGLEVDYIPDLMGPKDFRDSSIDYIIGAIHYVGQYENGDRFLIDHNRKKFRHGLENIYHNSIQNLVEKYYENLILMIETDTPDIIGHLDIIKKFNGQNQFFNEEDSWYQNIISKVIDTLSRTKSIVEVNTRGFYKGLTKEFYPSKWILNKCKNAGIPVTISSDAHLAVEIENNFEEVATLLLDIGYKNIHIFDNEGWREVRLNKNRLELKFK